MKKKQGQLFCREYIHILHKEFILKHGCNYIMTVIGVKNGISLLLCRPLGTDLFIKLTKNVSVNC